MSAGDAARAKCGTDAASDWSDGRWTSIRVVDHWPTLLYARSLKSHLSGQSDRDRSYFTLTC